MSSKPLHICIDNFRSKIRDKIITTGNEDKIVWVALLKSEPHLLMPFLVLMAETKEKYLTHQPAVLFWSHVKRDDVGKCLNSLY